MIFIFLPLLRLVFWLVDETPKNCRFPSVKSVEKKLKNEIKYISLYSYLTKEIT